MWQKWRQATAPGKMQQKQRLTIFATAAAILCFFVQPAQIKAAPPVIPPFGPPPDITGTADAVLIDNLEAAPRVKVKIYRHSLKISGNRPACWSFVTDGLSKTGQQEIVLTVLKRPSEADADYPRLPIKLFSLIAGLAKDDKIVSEGGYTEFKSQGFLSPRFKGLIYTQVTKAQGVPLPPGCLAMMPVTQEEMAVYHTAGPSRVLARLGRDARFFPFPSWCDRDRCSAFNQSEIDEMSEDPVFRSAKAQTYSLSALQDKDNLSLRVTDKTSVMLLDLLNQLPSDTALRLGLGVDPRADSLLVWETKVNNNRSMIAPEGSSYCKIGITFIALLPGLKKNEILTGTDGCALMMTREDYQRFKKALENRDQFNLPMAKDSALRDFSIMWSKE